MPIRCKRHEAPITSLLRTTQRRLLAAQQLQRIETDSELAVHLARRSCKRVRAVLRLLRSALGEQRFARDYGSAQAALQGLSATRDADVLLACARELALQDERWSAVVAGLMQRRCGLPPAAVQLRQAQECLAELVRLVGNLQVHVRADKSWRILLKALQRDYRRARRRIPGKQTDPEGDAWHAWRKAVKTHGVQIEVLRESIHGVAGLRRRRVDRLGDLLGWEHDLQLLAQTLVAAPVGAPHAVSTDVGVTFLQETLAALRTQYQSEARALGRRLFHAPSRRFARQLRWGGTAVQV